jgi:DNA ligase (NAD+)
MSKRQKIEIKELTEIINYHAKKYYDEDTSEISDFEYDMLVNELKNLKSKFPDIEIEESRYDRIGKNKRGFEK